jgi:hypothetical protein
MTRKMLLFRLPVEPVLRSSFCFMSTEQTRLYFGSAVVRARNEEGEMAKPKFVFGLLLRFHRMYSVALLYCAKKRLERA